MHGGNVDAGKNVLAAVASDDTSSGGRRTGTRDDGRTRSKPLSLSYKSSPPVAKHHPLRGATKRAATRDLLGLFLLAAAAQAAARG